MRRDGFTLVEVMVAVALIGAVVAVMGPVMTSSFESGNAVTDESRALDEIRVAVARIDKELRSAQCISVPSAGGSGSSLTFDTLAGTGGAYSVTYRVAAGALERVEGGSTESVATGLVATGDEFTHGANPGQRASVAIHLQVRFASDHSPRAVSTVIAGRNAWDAC
ncbi:MAG: prepilin-type N-terminal cleavage/methylation domain-containing protein [Actinobacteria bacterium]|nr:prepilin-type N-terminal cleavage/methylation domain-containing protein [Actinomycetota bacterium]